MASAAQSTNPRHVNFSDRMRVRRSRGAVSGTLLLLLGAWGALIPFAGPSFDYAYTPDDSWHYTTGRLWLEILPGAAAALGGLILLVSAHRLAAMFGGWLAAAAGAWFVVGQVLSTLWNDGVPAAGVPASSDTTRAAMEQIGFFSGLGAAILFLAALGLGRMSVVAAKDLEQTMREPADTGRVQPRERHLTPSRTGNDGADRTDPDDRTRMLDRTPTDDRRRTDDRDSMPTTSMPLGDRVSAGRTSTTDETADGEEQRRQDRRDDQTS